MLKGTFSPLTCHLQFSITANKWGAGGGGGGRVSKTGTRSEKYV